MPFVDADLEKMYIFCRFLRRRLPVEREKLPLEIQQAIDIESMSIRKRHSGKIKLARGTAELKPDVVGQAGGLPPTEIEALSQIIKELNQRFGTDFSDEDHVVISQIEQSLAQSEVLKQTIRVNTPENAMLTFKQLLEDLLQDMLKTNFKFYQKVDSDHDFAEFFTRTLFERYRKSQGLGGAA